MSTTTPHQIPIQLRALASALARIAERVEREANAQPSKLQSPPCTEAPIDLDETSRTAA